MAGQYIGKTDPPLTKAGIAHAHGLARRLRRLIEAQPAIHEVDSPISSVLSSPARRALETARLATEWTGSPIRQDADLWEIDFGRWEGMRFHEIAAVDPELVNEWAKGEIGFCFPGGESIQAFQERVERAGHRIHNRREDTLIVVTHGGVIRFLICHFLGLPPQSHLMFQVDPGSITRIQLYQGSAVLAGLNDFHY
uniref:Alpha-ribazole phosphatase n=1 Tax=Candidatus Kentrum sp. LFY TaxID=2126342 RepID=A0A450UAE2_9GAMM|nr:MAG: alpha-ribazole phosphatase [Candidatus Kentron sp. LFY]